MNGSLVNANIKLETTPYTKFQEHHRTQADIGLIVNYKDYIDNTLSFSKGVLLQAKKLFSDNSNQYTLNSQYNSFNEEQHFRAEKLLQYFRHLNDNKNDQNMKKNKVNHCVDNFRYLLYNPSFSTFSQIDKENILHRQVMRDNNSIFDYMHGLHLYNSINNENLEKSCLQTSSLVIKIDQIYNLAKSSSKKKITKHKLSPFSLGSVIKEINIRTTSLPWFIIFDLLLGESGCGYNEFIKFVTGECSSDINMEFRINSPRFILSINILFI